MNAPNPGIWAKKFPQLGTGPVPVEPYLSSDYFERERDKVFKKSWLKVARVEGSPIAGTTRWCRLSLPMRR